MNHRRNRQTFRRRAFYFYLHHIPYSLERAGTRTEPYHASRGEGRHQGGFCYGIGHGVRHGHRTGPSLSIGPCADGFAPFADFAR